MPAQMVVDERLDEPVRVVVAGLSPEGQGNAGAGAGGFQQLWLQLGLEERIGLSLVDQQFGQSRAIVDQGARVVLPPGVAVLAEVAAERLFAPRAVHRRDDWRER